MSTYEKSALGRARFEMRFSERNPDDVRLSWYVDNAIRSGMNVSVVTKRLLLAFFDQYEANGGNVAIPVTMNIPMGTTPIVPAKDNDELDLDDELVQHMMNIDFSKLEGGNNV